MHLHPDDLLLFNEVRAAMWRVAKAYDLRLTSVEPFPMPEYKTSPLGDCNNHGVVRLVLRGMTEGVWDTEPRDEMNVWMTAAHELAHLRYLNHGSAFQEFEVEMREAMTNQKEDRTQKMLKKLVKMQEMHQGFIRMGSTTEAEAFAGMINKLLIDHELNASDLDYARADALDPVIEVETNLHKYEIPRKKTRVAWQESLAKIVSKAHLCTFLISTGSNTITFVGTKSHATVAEYVYGTLVPVIVRMAKKENEKYERECIAKGDRSLHHGFKAAWINAFVQRIAERLDEVRKTAIKETAEVTGSESMALMRLDGALVKTRAYIDDKFGKKRRYASALHSRDGQHPVGKARGREAANRVTLGQKGMTGGSRKQLT